jgi:hypothetical protein
VFAACSSNKVGGTDLDKVTHDGLDLLESHAISSCKMIRKGYSKLADCKVIVEMSKLSIDYPKAVIE